MSEEAVPDSAISANLKQIEQRFPELFNLVSRRANRRSKSNRAPKKDNLIRPLGSDEISNEEQVVMDKWLQSHYDRLAEKLIGIDPNFPL